MRRPHTCLPLTMLLIVSSAGCNYIKALGGRPAGTKYVNCTQKINISPAGVVDEHLAVYVCDDNVYKTVTWTPLPGVTSFDVVFKGNCPFTSCNNINQNNPVSTVASQPPDKIRVYKYQITINKILTQDPHVVGGGGH